MPLKYRSAMMADRKFWVCDADSKSQLAIATVTANIVMPRLIELDQWRTYAENFFRRLCAHRRKTHDRTWKELATQRTEHEKLPMQVRALEEKVKQLERAPQGKGETPLRQERGRSTSPGYPLPEQISNGQLRALVARSKSPAYDTWKAYEAYRGNSSL